MRRALVMLASLLVFAGSASAAGLPRLPVDKAFRARELKIARQHPRARVTCIWQASVLIFGCTVWTPDPAMTNTLVGTTPARIWQTGSLQACGTVWASLSQGCKTSTAAASCRYALTVGSVVTVVNVCRRGWQARL